MRKKSLSMVFLLRGALDPKKFLYFKVCLSVLKGRRPLCFMSFKHDNITMFRKNIKLDRQNRKKKPNTSKTTDIGVFMLATGCYSYSNAEWAQIVQFGKKNPKFYSMPLFSAKQRQHLLFHKHISKVNGRIANC